MTPLQKLALISCGIFFIAATIRYLLVERDAKHWRRYVKAVGNETAALNRLATAEAQAERDRRVQQELDDAIARRSMAAYERRYVVPRLVAGGKGVRFERNSVTGDGV